MIPPPDARIERARYRLILDAPFFGALMVRLPVRPGYVRPTFSTDGTQIQYDQAYADTLSEGEIRYILCHEIMHCALGHLWRMAGKDVEQWNRACDYVVNQMLDDYAADCVKQGVEVPWTRPTDLLDISKQPQWRGLSAEEIYKDLVRQKQGQPPPPQQSQEGSGGGRGQQPQPQQPGQPRPEQGQPGQGDPDDGKPGIGDFTAPPPDEQNAGAEPGAESGLEEDWKIATVQAEQIAKMKGNCPGAASDVAKGLKKPKVDWRDVLREFAQQRARTDFSFRRPNKRHITRGFMLPSLHSERVGRLVAAFDSSGSTARYAEDYASELQSILDSVQPERLDVIVCDAKVRHVQSFEPGDAVVVEAKGRGGTDFRPVFDVIEDPKQAAANGLDIDDPPICLVYLTDLDGTFPRVSPDYPVLWIAVDAHGKAAPFGETIHV